MFSSPCPFANQRFCYLNRVKIASLTIQGHVLSPHPSTNRGLRPPQQIKEHEPAFLNNPGLHPINNSELLLQVNQSCISQQIRASSLNDLELHLSKIRVTSINKSRSKTELCLSRPLNNSEPHLSRTQSCVSPTIQGCVSPTNSVLPEFLLCNSKLRLNK